MSGLLEKVIKIGGGNREDYQVRDRLKDLTEDEALLGALLWEAFGQGHDWVARRAVLWNMLGQAEPAPAASEVERFLSLPQADKVAQDDWGHEDRPKGMICWEDNFHRLMRGLLKHLDAEVFVEMAPRLGDSMQYRLMGFLAVQGRVGPEELPKGLRKRLALAWVYWNNMRLQLAGSQPDVYTRPEGVGAHLIWGEDAWWEEVLALLLDPKLKACDMPRAREIEGAFSRATDAQMLKIMKKFDDYSLNEYMMKVACGCGSEKLLASVEKEASKLCKALEKADARHIRLFAGLLCCLHLEGGSVPDEKFDVLLEKEILNTVGSGEKGRVPGGGWWSTSYGALPPSFLEVIPLARREALVLLEKPPWHYYSICSTEAVFRSLLADGICLSTGQLQSSWDLNNALEKMGEALVPYAAEVLDQKFTRRPLLIEWLGKGRYEGALPQLVSLLGADAKTRGMVQKVLAEWGPAVLEVLEPGLTAKSKKMRTEAAKVLASYASDARAHALAAAVLEKEKESAIRALLEPLARQATEVTEGEGAQSGQEEAGGLAEGLHWSERARVGRSLEREGAWEELSELGAAALIPTLVRWVQDKDLEGARQKYWEFAVRKLSYSLEMVKNIQRWLMEFALRQPVGKAWSKEEERLLQMHLFEEGGHDALSTLGEGVLARAATLLLEEAHRAGVSEGFYGDVMGAHAWKNVEASHERLYYSDDNYEAKTAGVEESLAALKEAFLPGAARKEKLEEALGHVAAYEADGSETSRDDVWEAVCDKMDKDFAYYDLKEAYGLALLPEVVRWLQMREERGDFDEIWRTDTVPCDGWQNLCVLLAGHPANTTPTEGVREAVRDSLSNAEGWRALDALDAPGEVLALLLSDGLPAFNLVEVKKEMYKANYGALEEVQLQNIEGCLLHFASRGVDVVDALEKMVLALAQREHHFWDGGLRGMLQLLGTCVLDDGERDEAERLALVERLAAAIALYEVKTRQRFFEWLAERYQGGHPEGKVGLETLVEALGDKKKDVRQDARRLLGKMGTSVLEKVRPLLASKKITLRREAAEVVALVPHPENVPAIDAAIAKEKKDDIKQILQIARLESLPLDFASLADDQALDDALVARCDNLPAIPAFADPANLPTLTWLDGGALSMDATRWLISQLMRETAWSSAPDLPEVVARIQPESRDALCLALEKKAGEQSHVDDHWVLYILYPLASETYLEDLGRRFSREIEGDKEWASRTITVLGRIGSTAAVRVLSQMVEHARRASSRRGARLTLERIARNQGVEVEALIEGAISHFGFDAKGEQALQVPGKKKPFALVLEAGCALRLRDDKGKMHAQLPLPKGKQDKEAFEALSARLASLREDLAQVAAMWKGRLEEAMVASRCWPLAQWKACFLEHPVIRVASAGVIFWDPDSRSQFVIQSEGLEDAHAEAVSLEETAQIGVVHPVDLQPAERDAWQQAFATQQRIPAFAQLSRPFFEPEKPENAFAEVFERLGYFETGTALRRTLYRMGYEPHQVEGIAFEAYKKIGQRTSVKLEYDSFSLSFPNDENDLRIRNIEISTPENNEVPRSILSELIAEFERISQERQA